MGCGGVGEGIVYNTNNTISIKNTGISNTSEVWGVWGGRWRCDVQVYVMCAMHVV